MAEETENENNLSANGRIIPINIEDQMKAAYIDYSMSVIVSRALPDARDGLKPVHRRVLYGMLDLGVTSGKPYKNLPVSSVTFSVSITRMVTLLYTMQWYVWLRTGACATH